LGPALALGKPLLLTSIVRLDVKKALAGSGRGFLSDSGRWNRAPRSFNFYGIRRVIDRQRETIFVAATCFCDITLK
jgi:hypothetical protein